MKKILSVAVVVVLASCATAPTPAPAPVAAPVASPEPAPATAPVVAETPPPPKVMTWEDPLPVSIKSFYPNGDPSGTLNFQYNAQGFLVRQESLNGNGVVTEIRTGKAKGEVWRITITAAQNGEVISYEDRTLGAAGELLVQNFLNPKEVVQASNEYAYDALGRKVQWLAKTGAGGLQAKTLYKYDAAGNNIRTEVYDAGGTLTNVFESTYDDQGRIITRRGFDASSNLVEQTNFTWKDSRKVKEETVKPLLRTIEYSYGEKAAPTGIVSSVRGKVVERQILDYQWFTKTKTIAP